MSTSSDPEPRGEPALRFTVSHLESHSGVVLGQIPRPAPYPAWPKTSRDLSANPREVLERVLAEVLSTSPCVVKFSGGRDSSLVLAVAVHVCRTQGLPLPNAVAVRYPNVPNADEAEWQTLVTDHLGVPLEVIVVPPGGDDIAGPLAVSRLLRDGPSYPPLAGVSLARMSAHAAGGVLLTGEGGDNIFGAKKATRWVGHWDARRVPRGPYGRFMAEDIAPVAARRRLIRRRLALEFPLPWMYQAARHQVLTGLADDAAREPWDWRRATWDELNSRMFSAYDTLAQAATQENFTLVHPLIEPTFVASLCRLAGPVGFRNRTHVMRTLAADLLPEAVLARRTKARFNDVYAGAAVRSFAGEWDGSGVDPTLVDVEALRSSWLQDPSYPAALSPLQLALQSAYKRGWRPTVTPGLESESYP